MVYVSNNENADPELATIKVNDTVYDATDLPDAVKGSLQELVQCSNQRSVLEYRLRQLDAARTSFITALPVCSPKGLSVAKLLVGVSGLALLSAAIVPMIEAW